MRADLHLHTKASDGDLSPADLLQLASGRGLDWIAITDHDTTAGLEAAIQLGRRRPQILTGIELGCAPIAGEEQTQDIDILGYAFDPGHTGLRDTLTRLQSERKQRGRAIVNRLGELGFPIHWHRVRKLAAGESIGRPHIAQAMVEAGHVRSHSEAFEHFLRNGAAAHVPRWRLTAAECIALLHEAGGVAVIAHPGRLYQFAQRIEALLSFGLDGIEIIHPQHDGETTALLRHLAKRHQLLLTGGSDFHRPDAAGAITLGRYLAPAGSVVAIQARARSSPR